MYHSATWRTLARSLVLPNPMNLPHEHASTQAQVCQTALVLWQQARAQGAQGPARRRQPSPGEGVNETGQRRQRRSRRHALPRPLPRRRYARPLVCLLPLLLHIQEHAAAECAQWPGASPPLLPCMTAGRKTCRSCPHASETHPGACLHGWRHAAVVSIHAG